MPTPHKEKMCDGSGLIHDSACDCPEPNTCADCPGCPACSPEKEKREDKGEEVKEEKIFASCEKHHMEFVNEGKLNVYRPDECSKCHPTLQPPQAAAEEGEELKHAEDCDGTVCTRCATDIVDRTRKEAEERTWRKAYEEATSADCFGPERDGGHCCGCIQAAIKKAAKESGVNLEV